MDRSQLHHSNRPSRHSFRNYFSVRINSEVPAHRISACCRCEGAPFSSHLRSCCSGRSLRRCHPHFLFFRSGGLCVLWRRIGGTDEIGEIWNYPGFVSEHLCCVMMSDRHLKGASTPIYRRSDQARPLQTSLDSAGMSREPSHCLSCAKGLTFSWSQHPLRFHPTT